MEIVPILLITVAVLTFFSGLLIFFGASKSDKIWGVTFLASSVFFATWLYNNFSLLFGILFAATLIALIILSTIKFRKSRRFGQTWRGWRIAIITLSIFVVLSTIFDVVAVFSTSHIQLLAPPLYMVAYLIIFYTIVRYKIIDMTYRSLKILSFVTLGAVTVMIYMILFYVISKYLFKVVASSEIIAINLVMIIIVVAIFPIWTELNATISSLISVRQINLTYVTKKLNYMATHNIAYAKLADFLAEHLHFKYVGLIINDRVYGTRRVTLSKTELQMIAKLESEGGDIWQRPNAEVMRIFEREDLAAVAKLRDAKGHSFAQILVGKPVGKNQILKKDLAELGMVINLVASIVDSKERMKK